MMAHFKELVSARRAKMGDKFLQDPDR